MEILKENKRGERENRKNKQQAKHACPGRYKNKADTNQDQEQLEKLKYPF